MIASILFIYLSWLNPCLADIYTSADELARWTQNSYGLLVQMFDNEINWREKQINELKSLREALTVYKTIFEANHSAEALNPVYAFRTLNKVSKLVTSVSSMIAEAKEETETSLSSLPDALPSSHDAIGAGEALLRLQSFYKLKTGEVIRGMVSSELHDNIAESLRVLGSQDCFELGKIAYKQDSYKLALEWFIWSYVIYHQEIANQTRLNQHIEMDLRDLIDYMAYTAYKLGMIKYAAELTQYWLDLDPGNERAQENLEYYQTELEQSGQNAQDAIGSAEFNDDTQGHQVQDLCTGRKNKESQPEPQLQCSSKISLNYNFPEIRIEVLNIDPNIYRVHDIITETEANKLMGDATPQLERATIQVDLDQITSDARIAKTSWLKAADNPVVQYLEERLTDTFRLSMDGSESLQVVNYGLGGFYGPHLDSVKKSIHSNERLATILIYLNHVGAGGATVFPKLGLRVKPIERSAVFWYNIINGKIDERTTHTGCPVLLGTKWVATKWPREAANIFVRPCDHRLQH